jgi:hypothetical protein
MIYIPKVDFVFIHVPKAGGSAIKANLRRWWEHNRYIPSKTYGQHMTWGEFRGHVLDADRLQSYAIVRNPWDWLHSYYRYILSEPRDGAHDRFVKEKTPFAKFVDMVANQNFRSLLAGQRIYVGQIYQVKYVFHYSQLNHAWNRIRAYLTETSRKAFNYPIHMEKELEEVNCSGPRNDYINDYTPELIEQVGDLYEEDRRLFDFPNFTTQ